MTGATTRTYTRDLRAQIYLEATEFIDANLERDLAVETVAHSIATSRRQLQRVFEEVGGTTFRQYLLERRMWWAAQMLVRGAAVNQVAQRLGYATGGHFSRAFRRETGMSPTTYVRRVDSRKRSAARTLRG